MNILIVTGKYYPMPSANAKIIYDVANVLSEKGNNITVLTTDTHSFEENIQDVKVIHIVEDYYSKVLQDGNAIKIKIIALMRKIKLLFQIYRFPDVNPNLTKRLISKASEIIENDTIDAVIGVFRPFTAVATAIVMKELFPI